MKVKIGLDLGSRYTKVAIIKGAEKKLGIWDTLKFYSEFLNSQGKIDAEKLKMSIGVLEEAVFCATGYGRNNLELSSGSMITEISAHSRGIIHETGLNDFVFIDMGGQDTKVGLVSNGKLVDFAMNDKCAASTGRFIENMANVLDVTIEEISMETEAPEEIDCTCAVFGESELIGKISMGIHPKKLMAGVNISVAKKLLSLLGKFESKNYVATGGVALNNALLFFLEKLSGREFVTPKNPVFTGALGCAWKD